MRKLKRCVISQYEVKLQEFLTLPQATRANPLPLKIRLRRRSFVTALARGIDFETQRVVLTKGVVARIGIRNAITPGSVWRNTRGIRSHIYMYIHVYNVSGAGDTLSQRVPATWLCGMCLLAAGPSPTAAAKLPISTTVGLHPSPPLPPALDLVILRKAT